MLLKCDLRCAACVPEPRNALLGSVPKNGPDWARIAGEAARTVRLRPRTERRVEM